MFRGSDDWCLHARIMLALSNIHRAVITAQVKGSANIMVMVAATQELKAGDFLLRFKAEASQDDINGIRSIRARPVLAHCCYTWKILLTCTCFVFFLMFYVLYMLTAHVCW